MPECTPDCDMTKVINTRRATWICAKCKRDVSLQYLLWYQAAHPEEWGNAELCGGTSATNAVLNGGNVNGEK